MDLRGDLKTIRNGVFGSENGTGSSDGSIDVQPDFGCHSGCSSDQCAVCLEKRCNTLLLPCSHQFHARCIIQWTERQFSCPLCRSEITHFVPLRDCKSKHETDFARIWENHYITPPRKQPDVLIKTKPVQMTNTLKRTRSRTHLVPTETPKCYECCASLQNEFTYFAFDHKFCSTPCRLKYARGDRRPKPLRDEEGTNKFYVDYSQIRKYLTSGNDTAIEVKI